MVACLRVPLLHAFAMPFFSEFEDALNLHEFAMNLRRSFAVQLLN